MTWAKYKEKKNEIATMLRLQFNLKCLDKWIIVVYIQTISSNCMICSYKNASAWNKDLFLCVPSFELDYSSSFQVAGTNMPFKWFFLKETVGYEARTASVFSIISLMQYAIFVHNSNLMPAPGLFSLFSFFLYRIHWILFSYGIKVFFYCFYLLVSAWKSADIW